MGRWDEDEGKIHGRHLRRFYLWGTFVNLVSLSYLGFHRCGTMGRKDEGKAGVDADRRLERL
jgi:hypothetical protein